MKKTLIVLGSPRPDGNTAVMAEWVADGIRAAGEAVELIVLETLRSVHCGCRGCMACRRLGDGRCVLDDEISLWTARLPEYDTVVFATPVYFRMISAQLKAFLDRMYGLYQSAEGGSRIAHLRWALLATGGDTLDDGLRDCDRLLSKLAGGRRAGYRSLLWAQCPAESAALRNHDARRREAVLFGQMLASHGGQQ